MLSKSSSIMLFTLSFLAITSFQRLSSCLYSLFLSSYENTNVISSLMEVQQARKIMEIGHGENGNAITLFERSVTMQGPGCQNVKWTVDKEEMKITFQVESAQGADWVGIGISENGGMKGADIAIVKKTLSSAVTASDFIVDDRFSFDFTIPKQDTLQNVELLYTKFRESDQRIVAVIRRDLNTCDLEDYRVEAHKQHLICASGSVDSDGQILYHGPNNANAFVNLMLDEGLLLELPQPLVNKSSFT